MYWAEQGGYLAVPADPESTRFLLTLYETPMPPPTGFSVTLSPFRRPTVETMPTDAKAGCLYPNNGRAITEARTRGFDNALVRDMLGNVAETGTSNIFMVKDGVVMTPAPNRSFLAGITRRRVIGLLREAGVEVQETMLKVAGFPRRRRDFLHRQLFEGRADHAHRGPHAAARSAAREGTEALLGLGACLISKRCKPTPVPDVNDERRDGGSPCAALALLAHCCSRSLSAVAAPPRSFALTYERRPCAGRRLRAIASRIGPERNLVRRVRWPPLRQLSRDVFPISARGCFVSEYECRRWQNEAMSFAGQGGMLYARCTQGAPGY